MVAKSQDSITEVVKASVLPDLRKAIRESIFQVLEDMVKEGNALPKDTGSQTGKKQPPTDLGLRTSDIGHRTSDIGPSKGRYLYCIADGNESIGFGKIGIEDNEVYTIPFDDLCAVVHNCSPKAYQSEDQEIVKAWVLAHQKVVDTAWERFGTVIPIGFDTIIKGDGVIDPEENMRNWLRDDYKNLKGKIKKLKDKAEYGVQIIWDSKVIAEKTAEENPEAKKLQEEIKSKPRGMAYMYRQKLEGLLKKDMEKKADHNFKQFYERIKPYVDDLKVDKTKKIEDKNKQMLMNLACLLPSDQSKELGEELEKIETLEGFSVRYTGPWAPYSFV